MPARPDHLHMLVLDGVYTWHHGRPRFHRVGTPTRQRLQHLRDRLIRRLLRRLTQDGWLVLDSEQPWLDLEPADAIDSLAAASIRYRIALGPKAGRRTLTLKTPSLARLSINSSGQVVYRLERPFRDGTTHVLFSPEDFIARLAASVPRPGCNLTRYHGVFAPNSAFRRAVVPDAGKHRSHKGKTPSCRDDGSKLQKRGPVDDSAPPIAPLSWAQRLKRVFEFDITLCPHCVRLRVIAGGRLRM